MNELTIREDIIQFLQELPDDFRKDAAEFKGPMIEDMIEAVHKDENDLLRRLSDDERVRIITYVCDRILEEIANEFEALGKYWQSCVPSDEDLEKMPEEEFTQIIESFIGEGEALFTSVGDRLVAKLKEDVVRKLEEDLGL